ncbi:unnamed protein product [Symbiodinium sp. KB8]|nr:unnamed protein product [Symbiodinium sp. KB8]
MTLPTTTAMSSLRRCWNFCAERNFHQMCQSSPAWSSVPTQAIWATKLGSCWSAMSDRPKSMTDALLTLTAREANTPRLKGLLLLLLNQTWYSMRVCRAGSHEGSVEAAGLQRDFCRVPVQSLGVRGISGCPCDAIAMASTTRVRHFFAGVMHHFQTIPDCHVLVHQAAHQAGAPCSARPAASTPLRFDTAEILFDWHDCRRTSTLHLGCLKHVLSWLGPRGSPKAHFTLSFFGVVAGFRRQIDTVRDAAHAGGKRAKLVQSMWLDCQLLKVSTSESRRGVGEWIREEEKLWSWTCVDLLGLSSSKQVLEKMLQVSETNGKLVDVSNAAHESQDFPCTPRRHPKAQDDAETPEKLATASADLFDGVDGHSGVGDRSISENAELEASWLSSLSFTKAKFHSHRMDLDDEESLDAHHSGHRLEIEDEYEESCWTQPQRAKASTSRENMEATAFQAAGPLVMTTPAQSVHEHCGENAAMAAAVIPPNSVTSAPAADPEEQEPQLSLSAESCVSQDVLEASNGSAEQHVLETAVGQEEAMTMTSPKGLQVAPEAPDDLQAVTTVPTYAHVTQAGKSGAENQKPARRDKYCQGAACVMFCSGAIPAHVQAGSRVYFKSLEAFGRVAGAFHAAIEVDGLEWAFSNFPDPAMPRCPGVYCAVAQKDKSFARLKKGERWGASGAGKCKKYKSSRRCFPCDEEAVGAILRKMFQEYTGDTYDFFNKNCCHFADDFSRRLGITSGIPGWVSLRLSAGFAPMAAALQWLFEDDGEYDEYRTAPLSLC